MKFREIELNKCSAKFSIILFHATLKWMCYDNDIDKYKCGPAVTTLSDVASPNVSITTTEVTSKHSIIACVVIIKL